MSHSDYRDLKAKVKAELPAYKSIISQIPAEGDRLDDDGLDTFDIESFWKVAAPQLPATALLLRGVLTHSTNSAPPERVFSILNDTFDSSMTQSLNDYIELSLQLQYNERGRRRGA